MMIDLIAITNNREAGRRCVEAGVSHIMVDLESFGKHERQKGRDTVKSDHAIADIGALKRAVPTGCVIARCEPLASPSWHDHIEAIVRHRPDSVMIPMVESAAEVGVFLEALRGRAEPIIMIETKAALHSVDELISTAPDARFFVGLNDLHIQLGQTFMFEGLANGDVDDVARAAHRHGTRFGFGGLARVGQGKLPAEMIVREHVRLGSTLAILSRTFFNAMSDASDIAEFQSEVARLRDVEAEASLRSSEIVEIDRRSVQQRIRRVAAGIHSQPSDVLGPAERPTD